MTGGVKAPTTPMRGFAQPLYDAGFSSTIPAFLGCTLSVTLPRPTLVNVPSQRSAVENVAFVAVAVEAPPSVRITPLAATVRVRTTPLAGPVRATHALAAAAGVTLHVVAPRSNGAVRLTVDLLDLGQLVPIVTSM